MIWCGLYDMNLYDSYMILVLGAHWAWDLCVKSATLQIELGGDSELGLAAGASARKQGRQSMTKPQDFVNNWLLHFVLQSSKSRDDLRCLVDIPKYSWRYLSGTTLGRTSSRQMPSDPNCRTFGHSAGFLAHPNPFFPFYPFYPFYPIVHSMCILCAFHRTFLPGPWSWTLGQGETVEMSGKRRAEQFFLWRKRSTGWIARWEKHAEFD